MLLLPAPKTVLIDPGYIPADQIRKLLNVSKLREFQICATYGPCDYDQEKSYPYKGKMKKYPKFTNVAFVASYATYSDNLATVHHAIKGSRTLKAPSGMRFANQQGLCVVRKSDGMEYHPTLDDLFSKAFARRVKNQLAENFRRRAQMRKAEKQAKQNKRESERIGKIRAREIGSTRVTLADSRMAGNCVEGSLAFVERKLHIPRAEVLAGSYLFSVPASEVLASANGQTSQAERAIEIAWQRETTVCI